MMAAADAVQRFQYIMSGYISDPKRYNIDTIRKVAREHAAHYELPEVQAQEIAERVFGEDGLVHCGTAPRAGRSHAVA